MSTSPNNEDGDPSFQIAPMVDIVFVLLLFFMTYKTIKELRVEATPSGRAPGEIVNGPIPIIVDIGPDDTVTVNGKVVATSTDHEFADLSRWLEGIRSTSNKEEPFIIKATDQTRHERVVRVLSILNKAGFKKVGFA